MVNKVEPKTLKKSIKSTKKSVEEVPENEISQDKVPTTAKAGKRSAKAVAETEKKIEKIQRKAKPIGEEPSPLTIQKIKEPRSKLERRSKKYKIAAGLIDADKLYPLNEALELIVKTSPVKFDASVELHINLNVDPRHADQNVREMVVLPAGTGKNVKIAVLAEPENDDIAKKAGADLVGADKIFAELDKSKTDFDILISTPTMMAKLGKYAKLLGPKGLMPNPKSGSVTADIGKAVKQAKAGRVEYRVDSTGIIHLPIGKVGFGGLKLLDNASAIFASLRANKPASVKGTFINSVHLTTTMGPSIKIEQSSLTSN